MKLQLQTNAWSCLAASFAMALDVKLDRLIKMLGHDGSEIIWPELEEPLRRRAFHVQELIHVAYDLDYTVTEFNPEPMQLPGIGSPCVLCGECKPVGKPYLNTQLIIEDIINEESGVLLGELPNNRGRHAVAWDGVDIYDSGRCGTSIETFEIESFYMVCKR